MLAHFADFTIRSYPANCRVMSLALFCRNIEAQFPSPEHSALGGYYASPDEFMWGGSEEFVIAKGSDWCAELARVFCALCEMKGVPARIVFALDGSDHGHVLAECYDGGEWMLVDPLAAKLYRDACIGTVGAVRMHGRRTKRDGSLPPAPRATTCTNGSFGTCRSPSIRSLMRPGTTTD